MILEAKPQCSAKKGPTRRNGVRSASGRVQMCDSATEPLGGGEPIAFRAVRLSAHSAHFRREFSTLLPIRCSGAFAVGPVRSATRPSDE